jgi:hypothetical protein
VVDSDFIFRLGKKAGAILEHLLEHGGEAEMTELMERFAGRHTRRRDFRLRSLSPLEGYRMDKGQRVELGPPVIEVDASDTVRLVPDWRANLEIIRDAGKEEEDARLQAERYAKQRARFRNPGPRAEPTPSLPAPEETARIVAVGVERDEAARIEEQWRKAGVTCELFVLDTLAELGRIRFGLLKEAWKDAGGNTAHLMPAIKRLNCNLRKLPEHQNTLHVFPPEDMRAARRSLEPHLRVVSEPDPEVERRDFGAEFERFMQGIPCDDDCVEFGEPEPKPKSLIDRLTQECRDESEPTELRGQKSGFKLHPISDKHPVNCECDDCLYPTPKYARPWRGR